MTDLDTKHEKELIQMLCKNVNCIGDVTAIYISENFDSLKEFLNGTQTDFESIVDRKGKRKVKDELITGILNIKKDIPTNLSVRETAFFVLADVWLTKNLQTLDELNLDKISINPFLSKALSFQTSDEIISFNVYQSVTRSFVTSWGMMIENFLIYAGSEKNKKSFGSTEGSKPDVKKEVNGTYEYFQIKSGPNTMNASMVTSLNKVFEKIDAAGEIGSLGMTYGKRNKISSIIQGYLDDFTGSTLIGKELWDHISEEKNYHKKVINAITMATKDMLTKSVIELMDDKIKEIKKEWKNRYGNKPLTEVFEDYL